MLHANFIALCFIEPELLPIEVLHCGNRDFRPFCSCDLDLDPMTFIYELVPYVLGIYEMCKYIAYFLRQSFRKCSSDRQTDRHDRNYLL